MPKYTTATIVRSLFNSSDVDAQLTDAQIETFIDMHEGLLDGVLQVPSDFTFSATKLPHLLLRRYSTYKAALDVLCMQNVSVRTLRELGLMADIFAYAAEESAAQLLKDRSVWDWARKL